MNRFGHPIISKILVLFLLAPSWTAFAQDIESQETIPKAYPKDYVFLTVPYERPLGETRSRYRSESVGLGIRYAHRLDSEWIVGLKFERKPVIGQSDGRSLGLLVFSNQTQGVFRLYHPLYLLLGTELSMVMPSQKATPPFAKDPEFETEVALGLNASLWWLVSHKGIVELHLSRWKGTKTNKLQGLEASIGYGMGF